MFEGPGPRLLPFCVRQANICFRSEQGTRHRPSVNAVPVAETVVVAGSRRRQKDPFLQSFAKGLSVIRAFGRDSHTMTLSEVSARVGVTRAGARRVLLTLQSLGYVDCRGREFYLTPKILDLGYSYLSTMPLWNLAEPFMEDVVDQVHESCSASVLDGTDIVYVLRVPTKKIMTIQLSIGSRLPAWCTSMGRVLLGGFDDAAVGAILVKSEIKSFTSRTVTDRRKLKQIIGEDRDKGWSLVNQELEEGLLSVSVPLVDRSGRIIAAMNVSGHATRTTRAEMVREVLPVLQRAAERTSEALKLRSAP